MPPRGTKRSYDDSELGPVRQVRRKPVSNINTLTYCVRQRKKTRNAAVQVISFELKGKTRYRMSATCVECGSKKCTFLKSGDNPPATVSGGEVKGKGIFDKLAVQPKHVPYRSTGVKRTAVQGQWKGEKLTGLGVGKVKVSTSRVRTPRKRKSIGAIQTVGGDFNPSTATFW